MHPTSLDHRFECRFQRSHVREQVRACTAGRYLDEVQEIGELSPHPAQRVGALLRAASLAASQAAAAAGGASV